MTEIIPFMGLWSAMVKHGLVEVTVCNPPVPMLPELVPTDFDFGEYGNLVD